MMISMNTPDPYVSANTRVCTLHTTYTGCVITSSRAYTYHYCITTPSKRCIIHKAALQWIPWRKRLTKYIHWSQRSQFTTQYASPGQRFLSTVTSQCFWYTEWTHFTCFHKMYFTVFLQLLMCLCPYILRFWCEYIRARLWTHSVFRGHCDTSRRQISSISLRGQL